ncbi:MAG: DoxX family membrane protein [Bdellovibrionales bacterium]
MKYFKLGSRTVLGLIYFVFGLNFFFQFLPVPPSSEEMQKLTGAIYMSGYLFQFIKITEIFGGLMLMTNLFTPLALIILAPITLNILAMHAFLDPSGLVIGSLLTILHVALGVLYFKHYKAMLVMKAE